MTTRRILGSPDPVQNGKILFVYRHIGTNQVLYSLRQSMKSNQVLKQLPFAGRHTIPNALRKDLWTPFFTVTFPSAAQGLDAYHKLREMRKLREFCWKKDPNAEAIKEISKLQVVQDLAPALGVEEARANTEAGETEPSSTASPFSTLPSASPSVPASASLKSKTSTSSASASFFANLKPGELSKRQFAFAEFLRNQLNLDPSSSVLPSREILRKFILDHKATAVADLAAVFKLQEKMIPEQVEKSQRIAESTERRISAYEAAGRELAKSTSPSKIEDLSSQISKLKSERRSLLENPERDPDTLSKAAALKTQIRSLITERFKLSRAHELFGQDGTRVLTEAERQEVAAGRFYVLARKVRTGQTTLPPAGSARNYILGNKAHEPFSLEGVHVQWAELYDAEYASSWPKEVIHSAMTPYIRHTAPDPRLPLPGSFSDFVSEQKERFGIAEKGAEAKGEGKENKDEGKSFVGRWKDRLLGSRSRPVEASL